MANIINQIVTKSRAEGFQQTGQQIDELSKKQTRLANDSTNTGRQFASQASGLGGLVAAYAGAAATTFALQQSFSALSAAARSEALIEGVKSLAQSVGQDGPKIIQSLKGITRGQLSLTESAQNAGIALSAGLGSDQIAELADIATKASKTLGRDLTDSLQRLVRGVGKLEPELLDELGIFTRIEPAVERYAAKVGKAASTLTNFERRQAFANAVIEEGAIKYRNVDTSITDSSQNLNRLAANLQDLAIKLGQILTTILNPIIEFFNKDVANLAGLAALIGTLIFSKLGQVTRQGVDSFTASIQRGAASTTNFLTRATGEFKGFTKSITEAQIAADKLGSKQFAGPRDIQKQTREALGALTQGPAPADIPRIRQALEAQIAEQERLQAGRRTKILQLGVAQAPQGATPSQEAAFRAATQAKIDDLNTKITNTNAVTSQLVETNNKLGQTYGGLSGTAQKTGAVINGIATGFLLLGRVAGGALTVLGRLVGVFALLDIAGTLFSLITGFANPFNAAIESVGKAVQGFIEKLTLGRKTNQAFASSFLTGADDIKKSATNIENLNKAIEESNSIFTAITSYPGPDPATMARDARIQAAERAQNERDREIRSRNPNVQGTVEGIFRGKSEEQKRIEERRKTLYEESAAIRKTVEEQVRTEKFRSDVVQQFALKRSALQAQILKEEDANTRETLRLTIETLAIQEANYLKFFDSIVTANGIANRTILNNNIELSKLLQKNLGVSTTDAVDLVVKNFIRAGEQGKVTIKALGGSELTTTLQKLEKDGFTVFEKAAVTSTIAVNKLYQDMLSGAISADTLSAGIQNLQGDLSALVKEQERAGVETVFDNPQIFALIDAIKYFSDFRDKIAQSEQALKDLKDSFSGVIQASGALARTGNISSAGTVALTSEEQKANQLTFVSNLIKGENDIKKLEDERSKTLTEIVRLESIQNDLTRRGKDLTSEQAASLAKSRSLYGEATKQLEVSRLALKALVGESIDFIKTIDQINIAEKKRTIELNNQLDVQILQNRIAKIQAENTLDNLKDQIAANKQRLNFELAAARGDAGLKRLEREKASLEIDVAKIERAKQLLEVQQQLRDAEAERAKIAIAGAAQQRLLPVERQLAMGEAFAGLTNPQAQEQLQFRKQIIELEAALAQTTVDYNNAAQKNLDAAQKDVDSAAKRILVAQKEEEIVKRRAQIEAARIQADYELQRTEIANRVSTLTREDTLSEAQQSLSIKQIENQRDLVLFELEITRTRYEQLRIQGQQFQLHVEGLARVLKEDTLKAEGAKKGLSPSDLGDFVTKGAKEYSEQLRKAAKDAQDLPETLRGAANLIRKNADEQISGVKDATQAGLTQRSTERKGLYEQAGIQMQIRDARLGGLAEESKAAEQRAADAVQAARDEENLANKRLEQRRLDLEAEKARLSQQQQRQEAELRLLKEIARLKGDTLFVALAESIDIFRTKTSDFITTMLTDVINGTKKAKDVFKDFMFSLATEIQKALIRKTIAEPISNALAGGLTGALTGMTGGLLGGITPMTPGVTGIERSVPTTGLFGTGYAQNMGYASGSQGGMYAIGGPVRQMATGGANGLRDRVPAMLEPGEYVVRRPATKKLGFGKLNSINASGEIPLQLALDTVRKYGKGGDTELAHVNKKEQALLKRLGGSGTINRMTGLRQFWADGGDAAAGGGYGGDGYGGDGYGSGGDATTSAASQTSSQTSVDAKAEAAANSRAAENALSESRGVPGAIADTEEAGAYSVAQNTTSLFDTVANFAQSKIEQAINNPIATLIDAAFGLVSGPLGLVNTVSGLFGGPTVGSMATAAGRAVGEAITAGELESSRGIDLNSIGSLAERDSLTKDTGSSEFGSRGLDPQAGTAALDSFSDLGAGGAGSSEPPLMEEIKKADSAEIEKKVIELLDYNSALMDLIRSGGYADPAFARFRMQQFASGGYASRRDSVPALLEPGEFVVRRPAAMAIGGEVLRQMNATGQVGPGNVTVNVQNLGTSQSVVGTPKVSVNGRDLIIDVVVKDIQNNGAIRKTLRGM